MKRVRMSVAVCLVTAVSLAGAAIASASMSMSVTAAIKHQDQVVGSSKVVAQLKSLQDAKGKSGAKKLVTPIRKLAMKFDVAATSVSKASTTSATEKTAQKDWVSGVRMEAKGLTQIDKGLALYVTKGKAAARPDLLAGEKTILAGSKMRQKGDKLLKLSTND